MYQGLDVTVSGDVVRTADRAFATLEMSGIIWGDTSLLAPYQIQYISDLVSQLEDLFVCPDDSLADQMKFRALLCRKIDWHANVLETIQLVLGTGDPDCLPYFQEVIRCGQAICDGAPVDLDTCDELSSLCMLVSEAIWDHFTALHDATIDA